MQWSSIICLTLLIGCVEGLSKISVRVFHDRMQRLVIEFRPYFTLLKGFMYKHSELLNLVGLMCISLHFWKKFSNDLGSLPFRNEWTRTQFWVLTMSLILRIFHLSNFPLLSMLLCKRHICTYLGTFCLWLLRCIFKVIVPAKNIGNRKHCLD